ncbi:hypothetical protein, partial [Paenibacillus cymbidii]|uniref:hypothetical protein n=1 Tax=Paenibacillus cymbidii TaxID=1639034 RepID=UPI001A9C10F2
ITIALASIRQLVTSPRIYAKKGTTSNSRSLKLCVYFLDKGTGGADGGAGVRWDLVGWGLMSEPEQSWTGMPKLMPNPGEVAEVSAGAG